MAGTRLAVQAAFCAVLLAILLVGVYLSGEFDGDGRGSDASALLEAASRTRPLPPLVVEVAAEGLSAAGLAALKHGMELGAPGRSVEVKSREWAAEALAGWGARPGASPEEAQAALATLDNSLVSEVTDPSLHTLFLAPCRFRGRSAEAAHDVVVATERTSELRVGRYRHSWASVECAGASGASTSADDGSIPEDRALAAIGQSFASAQLWPPPCECTYCIDLATDRHNLQFELGTIEPTSWRFNEVSAAILDPVLRKLAPAFAITVSSRTRFLGNADPMVLHRDENDTGSVLRSDVKDFVQGACLRRYTEILSATKQSSENCLDELVVPRSSCRPFNPASPL